MRTITVRASREYDVLIGSGMMKDCGNLISQRMDVCKVAIITDETVFGLYEKQVRSALEDAGYQVCCFVFPAGEASKNLSVL